LIVLNAEAFDQCRNPKRAFRTNTPRVRIENGQAVRVAYQIYRGPNGQRANIEGVLPRSEFGIEIHISIAYLTFIVGLSIDKVCAQLKFFWNLDISKSQADALLNQLSRELSGSPRTIQHWKMSSNRFANCSQSARSSTPTKQVGVFLFPR